ncbi:MAG: succinate dehydrogenase assembly factor 2 [Sphingomonadaceae bacterium]|jgi:antitoxin CptB|nr:succinate dehydrogenase assembly factor 2 [Sphingomonadaceae bacterium]
MDHADRLRRLKFRAWHRGTREADYMIGGFFDRYHGEWGEAEIAWFEALLEEEDVDIMGWALGTLDVPGEYRGALMDAFRKLDYVEIPH